MALLELSDIAFSAGGRDILDGVTLSVEGGEVLALLGANGTGKSTLGMLVMGCEGYAPSRGTVRFEGEDLAGVPLFQRARKGISLAFQEPVRFEGVGVREYLSLRSSADPASLLRAVGMEPPALDRMLDRCLSGGERKRIELASLLGLSLRLAILDEPDSGIDMVSLDDIVGVVERFRREGTAVLLITHREEVARAADRAAHLCRGRVGRVGSPGEVAEAYRRLSCAVCAGPGGAEVPCRG